jgi:hypothetical protein
MELEKIPLQEFPITGADAKEKPEDFELRSDVYEES